jgi:glucose-1-phosphate adenylyltransferase
MRNVISLVLGGGRGTRLYPLTKYRSKPAVPLAGKYRLIDIPLSNCINSKLNRIYLITQFLSVSLHRHIRQTYRFDRFEGGFVEILAAQQTMEGGTDWFEGTADAVRKNIRYLQQPGIDYVLILSGDQLYRMDYREMLETHRKANAAVTIAGMPVSRQDAGALGVMRADETGRVTGFVEKPQTEAEIDSVAMDPAWIDKMGVDSKGRDCVASMGIYLFDRDALVDVLTSTDFEDFGREVFPSLINKSHVQTHMFDDYWEDIGTIKAFYDSNLSLCSQTPPFKLASQEAPVYSRARFLPSSRIESATIRGSLISDGCYIAEGAVIENSVIGLRSIIGPGVTIKNSILMGADFYESDSAPKQNQAAGIPAIGVGANSLIEGAIIDKNTRIGKNVVISNRKNIENGEDHETCVIRDGIPVVVKEAVIADGWML